METEKLKSSLNELLASAGISINGKNPWDIIVNNDEFYSRVFTNGSLGAGEAYVDKWWDCPQLDEFFARLLSANLENKIRANWKLLTEILLTKIFNRQTQALAFDNGQRHYDLGNDIFISMLDKRLTYTCGYWKNASNLEEAQENKLHLTCKKLNLRPGMKVLDIGCGWGSFAKFAAENYSVHVTGITVSEQQVELGRKLCAGLPVELKLMDYRNLDEKFDAIVSIGMFEHVGYKNYRTYMQIVQNCLKDDGLFLLHTIGSNTSLTTTDPWMNKYIFPGSMLPSMQQIGKAIDGLFVLEDCHNFGTDYDKTLVAWHDNFVANWDKLKDKYDEKFFRMWKYYLLMCAGAFRARRNQLWQMVFSKNGVQGGYDSIR
ncbi:MAG: cyclopropane fatty acyl phospholipid synthase [Ignavibacteriae bacterium]|nr:cyclopropane fatty acyl phospholipid synthase [Ignavibacteriota bacterium]